MSDFKCAESSRRDGDWKCNVFFLFCACVLLLREMVVIDSFFEDACHLQICTLFVCSSVPSHEYCDMTAPHDGKTFADFADFPRHVLFFGRFLIFQNARQYIYIFFLIFWFFSAYILYLVSHGGRLNGG